MEMITGVTLLLSKRWIIPTTFSTNKSIFASQCIIAPGVDCWSQDLTRLLAEPLDLNKDGCVSRQ